MALNAKAGFFDTNTSTGNQSVTGVGFQPKVVLFFGGFNDTTEGNADHLRNAVGWGISSTQRACFGGATQDNVTTSNAGRWSVYTRCYFDGQYDGSTTLLELDFISQDADGFTVNVVTADASARRVFFLALGGDDISDVASGTFDIPNSTGNQSVTGVGFQPDLIISAQGLFNTSSGMATNGAYTIGAARSSTERWSTSWGSQDGQGTTSERRGQKTDEFIGRVNLAASSAAIEADLVSMDADGFTYNISTAPGAIVRAGYLAIKGNVNLKLGSFAQPASTGSQTVTGVGFQPKAVALFSNQAGMEGYQGDAKVVAGAATGAADRFFNSSASTSGLGTSAANSRFGSDNVIVSLTAASGGPPTVTSEADFTGFASDGFTLDWSIADSTQRQVLYLALGDSGGGGVTVVADPLVATTNLSGNSIISVQASAEPLTAIGTLSAEVSTSINVTADPLSASTALSADQHISAGAIAEPLTTITSLSATAQISVNQSADPLIAEATFSGSSVIGVAVTADPLTATTELSANVEAGAGVTINAQPLTATTSLSASPVLSVLQSADPIVVSSALLANAYVNVNVTADALSAETTLFGTAEAAGGVHISAAPLTLTGSLSGQAITGVNVTSVPLSLIASLSASTAIGVNQVASPLTLTASLTGSVQAGGVVVINTNAAETLHLTAENPTLNLTP